MGSSPMSAQTAPIQTTEAPTADVWRPGERVFHSQPEPMLLNSGPWRTSAILEGPGQNRNIHAEERPPWGKGELVISALQRQAMQRKFATQPNAEEEAFRNSEMSRQLASV